MTSQSLFTRPFALPFALALALPLAACGEPGGHDHEQELITTVIVTLTPPSGDPLVATFDDPDGDGGQPPTVGALLLAPSTTYTLTVDFENRLETPPEVITQEVRDEAEDHQVFFTGTAVAGPATTNPSAPLTHSYADTDARGLPIGLTNTVVTASGTGELTVTLRHLPPSNDTPIKTADAAATVANDGFAALPGETDATATFSVTIP